MEITHKISLKARLAGGVAAVGLAACCMATPAFAVGTTASTDVTLSIDQNQIEWTAPTKIALAASADGTLTGPSAEVTKITNGSIFPIHVTNMAVEAKDPFHLASDVTTATAGNDLQFTLNNARAAASVDLSSNTAWNMGAKGSATESIGLTTNNAKIANLTADLTKAPTAATITWTVAAGSAAQA